MTELFAFTMLGNEPTITGMNLLSAFVAVMSLLLVLAMLVVIWSKKKR